ncbi:recombinase family protein [Cytobacillus suaedae]|nr:recombinase family protein [Cytobacillus suaedae]
MKLSNVLKKGSKGAFYGRHSTKDQDLNTQRFSVEKMVEKYKCSIIEVYEDEAVSATRKNIHKRPALVRLLDDLKTKKFDFIAVYNSDRLARKPTEHLYLRQAFKEYEIPVVISSSETLYDTGELVPSLVKDGITKFESDNIRDRTRDTFLSKTKIGEWTGGRTPFGYIYNNKTGMFTQKESELIIVKKMFELYKEGNGFQSIASTLNNTETIGVPWYKERVKSIITNPFYAGYMSMNIRKRKAYYSINEREEFVLGKSDVIPPVITLKEWEYCFDLYEQKRKRQLNPKHFNTTFLLKDLLMCKQCGIILESKNQKTRSNTGKEYGECIYFCSQCELRIIDKDIHKYVFYLLINGVLTKDFHRTPKNLYSELQDSFSSEVRALESDIAKLEKELGDLAIQQNRIDDEIRNLMRKGDKEKGFIEVVVMYRNKVDADAEKIKRTIISKKERIHYVNFVLEDFSIWEKLYTDNLTDGKGVNSFRRMALHLIDRIEVECGNGQKKEYRGEGHKHHGTTRDGKFNIFITAKMNMEQRHFLDIELNF